MSDSSDCEESLTPPDADAATEMTSNLLPEKSRKVYDKCYEDFMEWKKQQKATSFSENVLLAYFQELSDKFKCSSLWSKYSMLKSTLSIFNEVDISKYPKLIPFLKRKSQGFKAKKAKTFSPEQLNKFINEAPGHEHLLSKIALIFGIMGACRRQELYNVQFQDVEVYKNTILAKIRNTKNKQDRSFSITGKYHELCKEYISLRPKSCKNPWFFINYHHGKCTQLRVGINKFGTVGKTIADYLQLPNSEQYTGHCFRRTSATLLIDASGDITALKRHGGWKSTAVGDGYIGGFMAHKILVSNSILNTIENKKNEINTNLPIALTASTSTSFANPCPAIPIQLKGEQPNSSSDDVLTPKEPSKQKNTPPVETYDGDDDGDGQLPHPLSPEPSETHHGFTCSACRGPICGFRYSCVQCDKFDQCARCEASRAHDYHYMLRVPGPRPEGEVRAMAAEARAALSSRVQLTTQETVQIKEEPEIKCEIEVEELKSEPDPLYPESPPRVPVASEMYPEPEIEVEEPNFESDPLHPEPPPQVRISSIMYPEPEIAGQQDGRSVNNASELLLTVEPHQDTPQQSKVELAPGPHSLPSAERSEVAKRKSSSDGGGAPNKMVKIESDPDGSAETGDTAETSPGTFQAQGQSTKSKWVHDKDAYIRSLTTKSGQSIKKTYIYANHPQFSLKCFQKESTIDPFSNSETTKQDTISLNNTIEHRADISMHSPPNKKSKVTTSAIQILETFKQSEPANVSSNAKTPKMQNEDENCFESFVPYLKDMTENERIDLHLDILNSIKKIKQQRTQQLPRIVNISVPVLQTPMVPQAQSHQSSSPRIVKRLGPAQQVLQTPRMLRLQDTNTKRSFGIEGTQETPTSATSRIIQEHDVQVHRADSETDDEHTEAGPEKLYDFLLNNL